MTRSSLSRLNLRHHHERWDGEGYPDGLSGKAIPLEAAIVGLADSWDAMTTDRPYHRALTADEALAEVHAGKGAQFSTEVVDASLAVAMAGPSSWASTSATCASSESE